MQFGVLGPLEVIDRGGSVVVSSGKQRRLLAALLVHRGAVVSTERLMAVLWGDEPPDTALESLRTYVYRLRATLDADDDRQPIVTRPSGYVLETQPDAVDADRFEALVAQARREDRDPSARLRYSDEALRLWRGPAFAEFADAEFARPEAVRLEEARRINHRHPLRTRAREQLMLALYRCRRQSEALGVCRDFRELLDREGLDPPGSLQTLERDILRQSPP